MTEWSSTALVAIADDDRHRADTNVPLGPRFDRTLDAEGGSW